MQHRFVRMGMGERGHFPNRVQLDPVRVIVIDDHGITLSTRSKKYNYSWKDIGSSDIYQQAAYKAYGAGSWGKMVRRTFVLSVTNGNKFKIDISRDFPDFSNSTQLEELLKQYLEVNTHRVKKFNHTFGFGLVVVLVVLWVWLKKLGW